MKSELNSFPNHADVDDPGPSYTLRVAGPVKSIPEDAPFLPIRMRVKLKKNAF